MSLKWFHLVFITLSVALALGFGIWGLVSQYAALGLLSLVVAAALVVYEVYFVRKSRRIGLE